MPTRVCIRSCRFMRHSSRPDNRTRTRRAAAARTAGLDHGGLRGPPGRPPGDPAGKPPPDAESVQSRGTEPEAAIAFPRPAEWRRGMAAATEPPRNACGVTAAR